MFKYLQTICSNRRADSHQGIFIPAIPSQRANEVAYWQEVLQHTTRVTLKILFRKPIRYGPGRVAYLVCGRFSAFSTFKTAMAASCLIPPCSPVVCPVPAVTAVTSNYHWAPGFNVHVSGCVFMCVFQLSPIASKYPPASSSHPWSRNAAVGCLCVFGSVGMHMCIRYLHAFVPDCVCVCGGGTHKSYRQLYWCLQQSGKLKEVQHFPTCS